MAKLDEAQVWRTLGQKDADHLPANNPRVTTRENNDRKKLLKSALLGLLTLASLIAGIIASEQTSSKKSADQRQSLLPPTGQESEIPSSPK